MSMSYESSNVHAYIVGLGVPDRVARLFGRLIENSIGITGEDDTCSEVGGEESEKDGRKRATKPKTTTWPMEPMVPILVCSELPKAPVAGLMPPCESAIEVGKRLISDRFSGWLTLPVNSGGWFENLQQKLSSREQVQGARTAIHGGDPVLPLCLGIPLLYIDECGEESLSRMPEINTDEAGGWRALLLICWEIEYLACRPWHHSVYWAPIWKRRLRRVVSRQR